MKEYSWEETHRFLNENDIHLLLIGSLLLEPDVFPTDSLEKIQTISEKQVFREVCAA